MELNLYEDQPFPFTAEWYKTREHAPHAEQWVHQPRMDAVVSMALSAMETYGYRTVVDLGAGDGGMLSKMYAAHTFPDVIQMWGYDLMQSNVDYAQKTRGMDVRYVDFVDEPIDWAELVIITECLEHLENPHGMLNRIGKYAEAIVASSPSAESAESHDACHAWVWDMDGYARLIQGGGFVVTEHVVVQGGYDFQVILGVKP
jgi:hypothetical protein